MTRDDARAQQLLEVLRLEFMAWDLRLFLDTHPNCQEAQEAFGNLLERARQARQGYESQYGPLNWTSSQGESGQDGDWTQGPWPWQREV